MPERRDLFGECNVDAHPIDDFIRDCCANCINPDCTRSLAGKAKFDERSRTWFERYFGDKSRMDPRDPRFAQIAAQKFIFIDPGLGGIAPHVSSAWVDPRDVEAAPEPAPPPPPAPATPPTLQAQTSAPEPVPTAQAAPAPPEPPPPPPAPKPQPARQGVPHQILLANAPAQKGLMVPRPPGSPTASPAPAAPKDPWAGPVPSPTDNVPVVSPGARVKLGGGGV